MRHANTGKISSILALSFCSLVTGLNVVADDDRSGRVTVSGISSGAYAAVQAHVALSSTIAGAAAVAGGPYHCAEGNIVYALGRCISIEAAEINRDLLCALVGDEPDDIGPEGFRRLSPWDAIVSGFAIHCFQVVALG